ELPHLNNTTVQKENMIILVIAYFRSGSSLVGKLLSQHPRTFYHFEPLYFYALAKAARSVNITEGLNTMSNILRCDFTHAPDYLQKGKAFIHPFVSNRFLWSYCKGVPEFCFQPDVISQACKTSHLQVMKLIRLSLRQAHAWLKANQDIFRNVTMVHLVRDPRGIWSSRLRRPGCLQSTGCRSVETLCKEMREDIGEFEAIRRAFPDKIVKVRYEDVALSPVKKVKELYHRLRLNFTRRVSRFIDTHMTNTRERGQRHAYSTIRNSVRTALLWRSRLNFSEVLMVQSACPDVFLRLEYPIVTSEMELNNNLANYL
ncbi:unnamed protein product, partial [Ixodes hexagonus]